MWAESGSTSYAKPWLDQQTTLSNNYKGQLGSPQMPSFGYDSPASIPNRYQQGERNGGHSIDRQSAPNQVNTYNTGHNRQLLLRENEKIEDLTAQQQKQLAYKQALESQINEQKRLKQQQRQYELQQQKEDEERLKRENDQYQQQLAKEEQYRIEKYQSFTPEFANTTPSETPYHSSSRIEQKHHGEANTLPTVVTPTYQQTPTIRQAMTLRHQPVASDFYSPDLDSVQKLLFDTKRLFENEISSAHDRLAKLAKNHGKMKPPIIRPAGTNTLQSVGFRSTLPQQRLDFSRSIQVPPFQAHAAPSHAVPLLQRNGSTGSNNPKDSGHFATSLKQKQNPLELIQYKSQNHDISLDSFSKAIPMKLIEDLDLQSISQIMQYEQQWREGLQQQLKRSSLKRPETSDEGLPCRNREQIAVTSIQPDRRPTRAKSQNKSRNQEEIQRYENQKPKKGLDTGTTQLSASYVDDWEQDSQLVTNLPVQRPSDNVISERIEESQHADQDSDNEQLTSTLYPDQMISPQDFQIQASRKLSDSPVSSTNNENQELLNDGLAEEQNISEQQSTHSQKLIEPRNFHIQTQHLQQQNIQSLEQKVDKQPASSFNRLQVKENQFAEGNNLARLDRLIRDFWE